MNQTQPINQQQMYPQQQIPNQMFQSNQPQQPQMQIQQQSIAAPQQKIDPYSQIFVGGLDKGITEEMLWYAFKRFGQIRGIKIQKDRNGRSLGYGFITFINQEAANNARLTMNHESILNFPSILVTKCCSKEEQQKIKKNNIFIGNIPPQETEKSLQGFFSQFGNIISLKIKKSEKENQQSEKNIPNKQKLAYGYIAFENESDILNLMQQYESNKKQFTLHEQELIIMPFKQYDEREHKKNNLYIKEFFTEKEIEQFKSLTDEKAKEQVINKWSDDLKQRAIQYGKTSSVSVKIDEQKQKPYAFISFEKQEEAAEFQKSAQYKHDYLMQCNQQENQKNIINVTNFPTYDELQEYNKSNDKNQIQQQWQDRLKNECSKFGEVEYVNINIDQGTPKATIAFKEVSSANNCLEKLFKQEQLKRYSQNKIYIGFHEQFKPNKVDERFILLKNLKDDLTREQLDEIFKNKFGDFKIICLKKPKVLQDRQYSILLFSKREDSLYLLIHLNDHGNDDLNKLFIGGKVKHATICLPSNMLKEFQKTKQSKTKLVEDKNKVAPNASALNQQPNNQFFTQFPMILNNPYYGQMPYMHPQPWMQPHQPKQFRYQTPQLNQGQRPQYQNLRQQNPQNQNFRPQQQRFQSNQPNYQRQNQQQMMKYPQQQQFQQNISPNVAQGQLPVQPQIQPQMQNPVLQQQGFQPQQPNLIMQQQANQYQQQNPSPQWTFEYIKKNLDKFVEQSQDLQRQQLGQLIFPRVQQHLEKDQAQNAPKITGMLIDFSVFEVQDIIEFLDNDSELKERVQEAEKLIKSQNTSQQ